MRPRVSSLVLLGPLLPRLLAASLAGASVREIVGTWDSLERSQGGIGGHYEFWDNGTVCLRPAAMADYGYRLEGNTAYLYSPDDSGQPILAIVYEPQSDRLTVQQPGGDTKTSLEREAAGLSAARGLVATWRPILPAVTAEMDAEQRRQQRFAEGTRWRFTPDRRALLRIPYRTDCGSFSISGRSLRIELQRKVSKLKLRITDDLLTLESRPGGTRRFERSLASAPTKAATARSASIRAASWTSS